MYAFQISTADRTHARTCTPEIFSSQIISEFSFRHRGHRTGVHTDETLPVKLCDEFRRLAGRTSAKLYTFPRSRSVSRQIGRAVDNDFDRQTWHAAGTLRTKQRLTHVDALTHRRKLLQDHTMHSAAGRAQTHHSPVKPTYLHPHSPSPRPLETEFEITQYRKLENIYEQQ